MGYSSHLGPMGHTVRWCPELVGSDPITVDIVMWSRMRELNSRCLMHRVHFAADEVYAYFTEEVERVVDHSGHMDKFSFVDIEALEDYPHVWRELEKPRISLEGDG